MTDYADAMLRMFHRNIEAAAATVLDEPRTNEPARARRIIALLVETLGGFAYGTAAGGLARAVSTRFGTEPAELVRSFLPSEPRLPEPDLDRYLSATPRPLSVEMLAMLRARVGLAARDLETLAAATSKRLSAENGRLCDMMFTELNRDSVFDDRLEIELQTGWAHACAAIARHRPVVAAASPRARTLWTIWSRLAGNPELEPTRERAQLNGYIMRVG
jgi:hypothetical protein